MNKKMLHGMQKKSAVRFASAGQNHSLVRFCEAYQ